MTVASADFAFLGELLQRRAGIQLEPGKEYLVTSRLEPVARSAGLASVAELVAALRSPGGSAVADAVVDAMTTNETSWFRDVHPFESLRTVVLPDLLSRRSGPRRLSIWCAACSSGQEPYSVAILLKEHFPQLAAWDVRILATDISPTMIERARAGNYSQLEVNRGLRAPLLVRYFTRQGSRFRLNEDVRSMVEFRVHNLTGSWAAIPQVDVVLMRNVLIYFDPRTKKQVLDRVGEVLRDDGYLLLGGSETTLNLDVAFERVTAGRTTWYRPAGRTPPVRTAST